MDKQIRIFKKKELLVEVAKTIKAISRRQGLPPVTSGDKLVIRNLINRITR